MSLIETGECQVCRRYRILDGDDNTCGACFAQIIDTQVTQGDFVAVISALLTHMGSGLKYAPDEHLRAVLADVDAPETSRHEADAILNARQMLRRLSEPLPSPQEHKAP